MKFMQKRRFYLRLLYDMLFFLTNFCQQLNQFNTVIAAY